MNQVSLRHKKNTAPPQGGGFAAPAQLSGGGVPNSAMAEALGGGYQSDMSGLEAKMQYKLKMLQHQIPAAEAEADRLSAGVTSRTPEALKREMGERLGADLSGVTIHTDAASASRAEAMGAQAWTQGSDVYMGAGGFNAQVAAHELVHTVQQGAAKGRVNQSAPAGEVQMRPRRRRNAEPSAMASEFYQPAPEEYEAPPPEEETPFWINPFAYIRNKWRKHKAKKAREAAEQRRLAAREELREQRQNKRAWEMDESDFSDNHFNPGEDETVAFVQNRIDNAETPEDMFRALTGNVGRLSFKTEADRNEFDRELYKKRLKHMARMLVDYPELRGLLTSMVIGKAPKKYEGALMGTAYIADGETGLIKGGEMHSFVQKEPLGDYNPDRHSEGYEYNGMHELGHMLNYNLIALKQQAKTGEYKMDTEDAKNNYTADSLLKKVIRKLFGADKRSQIKNEKLQPVDLRPKKERIAAGQTGEYTRENLVHMDNSDLGSKFSTGYGRTDAGEFIAEAFADVYAHGKNARPSSIELVRQYERQRDKLAGRIRSMGVQPGRQRIVGHN